MTLEKVGRACSFLTLGILAWTLIIVVQAQVPTAVLSLTEKEQMQLTIFQQQRRAIEAEYRQQQAELAIAESQYADAVLRAHPGANAVFDPQSVSWVKRLGPVGASGAK